MGCGPARGEGCDAAQLGTHEDYERALNEGLIQVVVSQEVATRIQAALECDLREDGLP